MEETHLSWMSGAAEVWRSAAWVGALSLLSEAKPSSAALPSRTTADG